MEERFKEDWRQSKEWKGIIKALNLREETVSGVDEQAMVTNYVDNLIHQERQLAKKEVLGEAWELIKATDGTRSYRSVEIINRFLKLAKQNNITLE